jgi:hypothetical protein
MNDKAKERILLSNIEKNIKELANYNGISKAHIQIDMNKKVNRFDIKYGFST